MNIPLPLLIHFAFMATAVILLVSALLTARKRGDNWFKKHRSKAIAGVVFALMGASTMAIAKTMGGKPHLATPHAMFGLGVICLWLLNPVLGLIIQSGNDRLRVLHRVVGRVAIAVGIVTAGFGISMVIKFLT